MPRANRQHPPSQQRAQQVNNRTPTPAPEEPSDADQLEDEEFFEEDDDDIEVDIGQGLEAEVGEITLLSLF